MHVGHLLYMKVEVRLKKVDVVDVYGLMRIMGDVLDGGVEVLPWVSARETVAQP